MRLYRGLKRPYDPSRVASLGRWDGTDFTDCPFTALQYARGRDGVVLVVDAAPEDRVTDELWMDSRARRLMYWGCFDRHIVAVVPAKELRAQVRRKGVASASEEYKALILKRYIDSMLAQPRSPAWPE
jgi:hypothetical protein